MMTLQQLKVALAQNPEAHLRFVLPDGEKIHAHAHVTEVARLEKTFVDCGGTRRASAHCQLQLWIADDLDHRLDAKKLLAILSKAQPFLGSEDLTIEVEHEVKWISQFPVDSVRNEKHELILQLGVRHTACLAPDKCLPKPSVLSMNFKTFPTFVPTPR